MSLDGGAVLLDDVAVSRDGDSVHRGGREAGLEPEVAGDRQH